MTRSIQETGEPIRVGVVALGRSGWGIHVRAFREMPEHYQVVAVTDPDETRRAQARAEFGCNAYDTFEQLLEDAAVELVVVTSPSPFHAEQSIAALGKGKHVVCEKPFALNSKDAERVIEAAQKASRIIAPFQNRRYEKHFQKVKSIVDSGVLGEIKQIRMGHYQFGRRWDWQTLKELGGGMLNNHGPHLLDQALQIFDEENAEIFCDLKNILSCGDAEDRVKIVMKGKDDCLLDIEIISNCAYPQDNWLIMGTAGSLRGSAEKLEWKYVDWSTMPERQVEREPVPDRSYLSETLQWKEESWEGVLDYKASARDFYDDFYKTIREGQALFVTPESVVRQIKLIEKLKTMETI